jgi:Spy/CpxP family protein refolding chaperone
MVMQKQLIVLGCVLSLCAACIAQEKPAGEIPEQPAARPAMGAGAMDGDFPMMLPMMMNKELGLSKEQQQQIKAILSGSTNEMQSLHAKMQAAAKVQGEMMSQDSPNEAAVLQGVTEIAAMRTEIARIRVKQLLEVQKLLTPEQRAKMREKMKERMQKRGQGDRRKMHEMHKDHAPSASEPAAPKAESTTGQPAIAA